MSLGWSDKSNIYSNITGSVQTQLEHRKDIVFKKTGRTDSDIQFLNTNTGWVKLSSGIKEIVKDSKLKGEENVLFGGVFNNTPKLDDKGRPIKDTKIGIQKGIFSKEPKNSSYTYSQNLGFRPMAGIINASIKNEGTFGAIKRATIEFVVNSLEDLNKFEKLYMLPGYSVLLEWGHSLILGNDGKLNSLAETYGKWFIDTPSGDDAAGIHRMRQILDHIDAIRSKQAFNYDSLLGKISNYIWKFNPDGTYTCSVDIVGYGELAESMSVLFTPMPSSKQKEIGREANSNIFDIYLSAILDLYPSTNERHIISDLTGEVERTLAYNSYIYKPAIEEIKLLVSNYIILRIDNSKADDAPTSSTKYITLGSFINLINTVFVLKDDGKYLYKFYCGKHNPLDKKATDENNSPFVTFDDHISSDIGICFLPKTKNTNRKLKLQFAESDEIQRTIHGDTDDILNILVNVSYIKDVYKEIISQNKNEDINGYDFIKTILDSIAKCLGNINSFSIEARDERYFIADRNTTPSGDQVTYTLDLFGLKSLATDISLQSSIPSSLSTLISIGASAGGADINENVYNFQSFYKNFIDRIVPQRALDPVAKSTGKGVFEDSTEEDNEKLKEHVKVIGKYLRTINGKRTIGDIKIESLIPSHQVVTNLLLKRALLKADTNAPGVVPIQLSFSIMGISGLRITDTFNLGEGILPERYKGNVAFTITGVNNTISGNKWTTDVTALMMMTTPLKEVIKSNVDIQDILEEINVVFPEEILDKEFPNATRVRKWMEASGSDLFTEKGNELTSSGMDITKKSADLAISLMRNIQYQIKGEDQFGVLERGAATATFGSQLGVANKPDIQLGPTVLSSLRFRWTGGNDSFHLYNPKDGNTLHRFGKALDLAIQQLFTPGQATLAKKIVAKASEQVMSSTEHNYKDEYKNPSSHANGPHFHFSVGGATAQTELRERIEIENRNKRLGERADADKAFDAGQTDIRAGGVK